MPDRKKEIVRSLNLKPHPEGGFYAETYRSAEKHEGDSGDFPAGRNISTGIYYLLGSDDFSCFHRIKSDEMWHHYEGSPVTIHVIHVDGLYESLHLGKEVKKDQKPQLVVPAYAWFGVTVDKPGSYALCGCTVAPGFDFTDFEMANRYQMIQAFPEHADIIRQLTPSLS